MEKFCQECGSNLESNLSFCPECGSPVVRQKEIEEPVYEQQVNRARRKRKMSVKKKVSFALMAIIAVGLIAGHFMILSKTSPEDKIQSFLSALDSHHQQDVMAEMNIAGNVLGEQEVFFNYLITQDLKIFNNQVKEVAGEVLEDGKERAVKHENGEVLLSIRKEKYLGIYSIIEIDVIPAHVEIVSDLPSGEYKLAGKTIDLSKGSQDLGLFLPGSYQASVSAAGNGYGSPVETEHTILIKEDMVVEFNSEQLMVNITSNDPKAIVYINHVSTGKTIDELKQIGPVFEGENILVFVQGTDDRGNVIQSEQLFATGGDTVNLPIHPVVDREWEVAAELEEIIEEVSDFTEESLEEFYLNFRSDYEASLNAKDFSLIEKYLIPGNIAHQELEEFIGDIGSGYYLYEFLENSVNNIEIQQDQAFIETFEEFNFTNHAHDIINYQRSKLYEIIMIDGAYKIIGIDIWDTQKE